MSTIFEALKKASRDKERHPLAARSALFAGDVEATPLAELERRQRRSVIRIVIVMGALIVLLAVALAAGAIWVWRQAVNDGANAPTPPANAVSDAAIAPARTPIYLVAPTPSAVSTPSALSTPSTTPPLQTPPPQRPITWISIDDEAPPEGPVTPRVLTTPAPPIRAPLTAPTPMPTPLPTPALVVVSTAAAPATSLATTTATATNLPPEIESSAVATSAGASIQAAPGPSAASSDKPAGQIGALRVGGILWSKDKPVAIVNDQMVGVGDTVRGFRVVAIGKDFVELEQAGERFTLHY